MSNQSRYYAVDQVEHGRVLLIDDERGQVELTIASLPFRVREGMVLSVPLDANGRPEWLRAAWDESEEQRRVREGDERLTRLRRRDPGGDIKL